MVDAIEQSTSVATKPCRTCGEDIRLAAKKCVRCSSYQDWRGGFGSVSSTLLSLLVALVSVLTAGIPIIKAALTPSNSELTFSVQDVGAEQIALLIANSGARSGSVRTAAIHFERPGKRSSHHLRNQSDPVAPQSVLIEAGTAKLITFFAGGVYGARANTNFNTNPSPTSNRCWVEVEFTNFDGTERNRSADIDCKIAQKVFIREFIENLELK